LLGRRTFEAHLRKMPATFFTWCRQHWPMLQRSVAISLSILFKAERA
jgi:hypothetical protein